MKGWTYGAEHELVDWHHARLPHLPAGVVLSPKEYTIVNNNGIATDPSGKLYCYGGELNTPPTETPEEQGWLLSEILDALPDATINYRCCLHVHVRVPGLRESLPRLKRVWAFFGANHDKFVNQFARLPEHWADVSPLARKHLAAKRKMRATIPQPYRFEDAARAETLEDFFAAEAPKNKKTGQPLFHAVSRSAVNVRQLHQSDTVEFRHFAPTLDPAQVQKACEWARDFLLTALEGLAWEYLLADYLDWEWPETPEWNESAERGYLLTNHDGKIKKAEIAANIDAIRRGEMIL